MHTHFQQGQLVHVQMRDGTAFKDRFFERRSRYVVLEERGRIAVDEIRAISIVRRRAPKVT